MAHLISDSIVYSPICNSIFLNFSKNGHGCRNSCPFCYWKNNAIFKENSQIIPSDADIDDFLKYARRRTVTISGGGDPLWNFEKNKGHLYRIIDKLHSSGRTVELITRDYITLISHIDEISNMFDYFSFSISEPDENILNNIIRKLPKERIRISYVTNGDDIDTIDKIYSFYKDYVRKISIKENYMEPLSESSRLEYTKRYNSDDIIFMKTNNYELVLFGEKILTTKDINDMLVEGMNGNI